MKSHHIFLERLIVKVCHINVSFLYLVVIYLFGMIEMRKEGNKRKGIQRLKNQLVKITTTNKMNLNFIVM